LLITFTSDVEPGVVYPIELGNVIDCSGNAIAEAIELEILVGFEPALGDLIITELMPDPDDDFDSPNDEYIELYNKSNLTLELTNVTLSGGNFTQQVLLQPGEYLIVTNEDNIGTFLVWPNTVGMDGFPALTNSGRLVELFNGDEELLDAVSYDISWYRDTDKDDGGWSLELINPDLPCSGASNWTASNDESGATPGEQNSVFDMSPDLTAPQISTALVEGATEILLQFNEPINDDVSGLDVTIGRLENGAFVELAYELISSNVISEEEEPYPSQILLTFDQAFSSPLIYEIRLNGISDCSGNSVLASDFTFAMFAVPEMHEEGDLIINEILFNPKDDGVDYIEIYNRSNKNINLEGWKITNTTSEPQVISTEQNIIFRGDYALLSKSNLSVKSQYPLGKEENFIELDGFPSFSNGSGTAVLMDSLDLESDKLTYSEDQQYPLLNSSDGVALERIDAFRKSTDLTNWHSASESVGFGTPGYLNSQNTSAFSEGDLSLSPAVFSPDNDGFEDVLNISIELPKEGYTGTITIYNDRGLLVRTLVLSDLLGTVETFSWDGFDNQQQKSGIGMYIIHFEGFHPDGDTIDEKAVGVLGARLN
ncbi:MAG: lamin tail domain-containing protein, partial [Flavobacteriales bacterium]